MYGIIFKNKQNVNSETFRIYYTVLVLRLMARKLWIGHVYVRLIRTLYCPTCYKLMNIQNRRNQIVLVYGFWLRLILFGDFWRISAYHFLKTSFCQKLLFRQSSFVDAKIEVDTKIIRQKFETEKAIPATKTGSSC